MTETPFRDEGHRDFPAPPSSTRAETPFRLKRRYVVVAVLSTIVFMAATWGCGPPVPTPQPGNNPVIVGDSIVWQAQVHGAMNVMHYAFIDADPGRSVNGGGMLTGRNGVAAIGTALTHLQAGGWLVLELGTNDLPSDPALYRAKIVQMLGPVPASTCVAFVTVADWSTPERQGNSVAWNDNLKAVARLRTCYRIIDWWENTRLRTYQVFRQVDANGKDITDFVHPNSWGERELATMIQWSTA